MCRWLQLTHDWNAKYFNNIDICKHFGDTQDLNLVLPHIQALLAAKKTLVINYSWYIFIGQNWKRLKKNVYYFMLLTNILQIDTSAANKLYD